MTAEAPRLSNEAPKPIEFYNPVTDRAKTLEKLTVLSKKEPTDVELFEAISDTFATMSTIDFKAEKTEILNGEEFKAREWWLEDECSFPTKSSGHVHVSYWRPEEEGMSEEAYIAIGGTTDINFKRDGLGSIGAYKYSYEKEDDFIYEAPSDQRKIIIETLLEGLNFYQPVTA
ncbi:MAG: hypothetical protein A3B47_04535 [Candidatus Levybacteria bacterium RIFCSPLOWO2_01_FULL_39_24]|nr:MAG: hypothetical protein A2800_03905 [Candidatus Levybacteria bacterium RIFCSPHIGHO2_01_FULL_40_16]OGH28305.1 MAG: hypothetical protein A3E12_02455 [Candidatus Levybacteria bacterium RIFCSPHIGHO2_12_FULL_39_9]OGH46712.1 MAG: hypothetical protein A3B47_04535 [Candidatus Levybacteria bacterium RIFCSPLOWO2_01_FULL_39_24]